MVTAAIFAARDIYKHLLCYINILMLLTIFSNLAISLPILILYIDFFSINFVIGCPQLVV